MATAAQAATGILVNQSADEFEDLFHRYWQRGFHFALQTVGNREDAIDLAQEAFLRVHRHWGQKDSDRPFAPWFFKILRNLAIDRLRRRASRPESQSQEVPETDPGPGPEVLAEKSEIKARVWQAIGRLPEPQREVLILRDIHGFSYKEIAEIGGTSVSTVTSRLHSARETLRRKLGDSL